MDVEEEAVGGAGGAEERLVGCEEFGAEAARRQQALEAHAHARVVVHNGHDFSLRRHSSPRSQGRKVKGVPPATAENNRAAVPALLSLWPMHRKPAIAKVGYLTKNSMRDDGRKRNGDCIKRYSASAFLFQNAAPFGKQHKLGDRLNLQLVHDVVTVRLDRAFRGAELVGDLLVELSAHHKVEHLTFARRQLRQAGAQGDRKSTRLNSRHVSESRMR